MNKWGMNMVKKIGMASFQLVILILICQMGNYITSFFHLEIPGNVVGILILFGLLASGILKMDQIQFIAGWLLKHLGFFFIPIAVGLMTMGSTLLHEGIYILLVLSVSAVIGFVFAGQAAQMMINRREEVKVHDRNHTI